MSWRTPFGYRRFVVRTYCLHAHMRMCVVVWCVINFNVRKTCEDVITYRVAGPLSGEKMCTCTCVCCLVYTTGLCAHIDVHHWCVLSRRWWRARPDQSLLPIHWWRVFLPQWHYSDGPRVWNSSSQCANRSVSFVRANTPSSWQAGW